MDPKKHHNALNPESRLHWYEIKSILGQGGFGITYLAFDTNLKQQVAIKEYLPVEFSTRDTTNTVQPISENHGKIYGWGLQRFLEEAQTLARFKHPNIVQIRTFFEENNTGYIVMDYEKGVELATLIDEGAHFSEQRLLEIVLPILDGLGQIHKAGVIHRDIKPENIFIRSDQSPVLLDFGSARHAIGNRTKTMTSLVTPGYAPFEQYHQAEGKQGPWTDIYALGATCYCALTGKPPPDALKRGMVQFEHNLDVYLALADIKAGKYSDHVLDAIDCALRFRERDRPQTVMAWQQMLAGSKPVPPAEARSEQVKFVESPAEQSSETKTPPEQARDRAGSSLGSALRGLLLLGLVATAGWYAYDHHREIESWIRAFIEEIDGRQVAVQEKVNQDQQQELPRQEAESKENEQMTGIKTPEQQKLEQQRRAQRIKELQAELSRLELEAQMAEQPGQREIENLRQEKERLAELARRETEQRKREEQARIEAERKLEEERQRLERENERLAQLKKQAEEEAQRQAEENRLAELARQREALVQDAALAEQQAKLAQLEEDKRKQTELARQLVIQQEMSGLSAESAIEQLREELGRQSGQEELVVDDSVLSEIVHKQMEIHRAKEAARLKAENLAVAKRLLQSAKEFYRYDRLEEALTDYRNAYDLNASSQTHETAIQGIIDTLARLYARGNSETWQFFKGDQTNNLSGEYNGNYRLADESGEQRRSLEVSTMVAHKDNQLTMAVPDLGVVVTANIEDGNGDLSFHDVRNNVHGSGTITTDSHDSGMNMVWSSDDGSTTGNWRVQNQSTLWHIDLNGEYLARVTNAHVSVFREKTFNFRLTDLTAPDRRGYPDEIMGASENENIKLSGSKIEVNRIKFEFISSAFNIQGNGWFEVTDVHGELIKGGWEIPGFGYNQSSGEWILQKME